MYLPYFFFYIALLRCWDVITEVLLRLSTVTVTLKDAYLPAFTYIYRQTKHWYNNFLYEPTASSFSLNSQTDEIPGTSMEMNVQCKIDSSRKSILQSSQCTDIFSITNQVTFYRCKMYQFGPFYSAVSSLKKVFILLYFHNKKIRSTLSPKHFL